jgi:hypothetical protein
MLQHIKCQSSCLFETYSAANLLCSDCACSACSLSYYFLFTNCSIPDHAYFEQYGPTFDLHTAPRRPKDCNTPEAVQQLRAHIAATLEQVRCRRLESEARAAAKTASTAAAAVKTASTAAVAAAAAAAASAAEAATNARAVTDDTNAVSNSSSSGSAEAAAVQAAVAVAPAAPAVAVVVAEHSAPELVQNV